MIASTIWTMSSRYSGKSGQMLCRCGLPSLLFTSRQTHSYGRQFYRCPRWGQGPDDSKFFRWADSGTISTCCQLDTTARSSIVSQGENATCGFEFFRFYNIAVGQSLSPSLCLSGLLEMSSGRRTHKLSTGMLVSGLPPAATKVRAAKMSSAAAPYTGGDVRTSYTGGGVRTSGELARMFDIPIDRPSVSTRSHSGPIARISGQSSTRMTSGPLLSPTGLITSGPVGEFSLAPAAKKKMVSPGVTVVESDIRVWYWLPKVWLAVSAVAFMLAIGLGAFLWAAAGRPQIFLGFVGAAVVVGVVALWNWTRGRRELERYFRSYPDTAINPRNLPVGKLVKITGLVTCGNCSLETSYQIVPRCAYTSIELYECKAWNLSLAPCIAHSWTLRHSERHVTDFYVSTLNSGTRVLVRAGNGVKVVSFIKPAITLRVSMKNKEQFPSLLRWLQNHNIPNNDLKMRFEEGYIREGSTVSVIGTLKTHENIIMIDPPDEASSTGWQWKRCFLPMHVQGLILVGDETPPEELCHV
ncbi:uncharacterized membrane protein At1g16860-like [Phalaenopsis equestris]|uniref:uncharacterized membrane protein At1g16860-like n=1 Tax=Phalaenopsis equestris TaxID=78828 RepID=UPI0009E3B715|nr:uncharacterized membrane protein At1g16860-like [Phalaenopsis equestris]